MKNPTMGKDVFIDKGAVIIGDVQVGDDSSFLPNCVARGDINTISIGSRTNIQDCSVIHCGENASVKIGDDVSVGHACIIHGCTIGDRVLIGMGSIIMNNATIGNDCMIGAGSLVTEGTIIPDGSLAFGRPAKVMRPLTKEQIADIAFASEHYVELAKSKMEK